MERSDGRCQIFQKSLGRDNEFLLTPLRHSKGILKGAS